MRRLKNVLGSLSLALLLLVSTLAEGLTPTVNSRTNPVPQAEFKPGEILVKFRQGFPAIGIQSALAMHDVRILGEIRGLGVIRLAVPIGEELRIIEDLRRNPLVEYAEPDYIAHGAAGQELVLLAAGRDSRPVQGSQVVLCGSAVAPNDEYYSYQWNLPKIEAPQAWDITIGGDVVIAILDTGVDLEHPDLDAKIWMNADECPGNGIDDDGNGYFDDVYGWDFVNDDNDSQDDNGKGTFVAGIAAAETDNEEGVAGVSWGAKIMPVKVLNSDGHGYFSDIVAGICYAADSGARIINMSFASTAYSPLLADAVNYAHDRGCLLVAMAGDWADEGNPIVYPAALDNVVAVAATDDADVRWPGSEYGPYVDIAAPGSDILGPYWVNGIHTYALFQPSTFAAAPHVAGLAALIWSVNPHLTPDEVEGIIEQTAVDLGDGGRDDYYGWGRIDANAAVKATPHYLQLSPAKLLFLADDDSNPPPWRIVNPGTSSSTWIAAETAGWLSMAGPTGNTPSYVTVSVDKGALPGYGTYTSPITVTSTMSESQNSPLSVDVILSYVPQLKRVYLPRVHLGCTR